MFTNFEPVLNSFDVPIEEIQSAFGSEPAVAPEHFGLVAKALEKADLASRVNAAIGNLSLGRIDDSIAELHDLRRLALNRNDRELAECACHNLAVAYRENGELLLALSWQQQSIAWQSSRSRRDGEDDSLARLACDLTGRGTDEFLRGDYDLCESFWRRSLAIEEWRGCLEGQATDCGNLGLLAATRGDLATGVRWLRKSHRLHRLMFDLISSGKDLLNLAELFRLLGEFRRSTICLRRSVRCFHRAEADALHDVALQRLKEALRTEAILSFDARRN